MASLVIDMYQFFASRLHPMHLCIFPRKKLNVYTKPGFLTLWCTCIVQVVSFSSADRTNVLHVYSHVLLYSGVAVDICLYIHVSLVYSTFQCCCKWFDAVNGCILIL